MTSKQDNIISVKNLSKRFKDTVALDQISFSIKKGEILGFLGPSGSGKTTTINIFTKQLAPDQGDIYILGKTVGQLNSNDFKNIGIMSDTSGYYEKLSLLDNLRTYADLLKADYSYVDSLLKELDLYEDRDKPAEKLSTGMKKRMLLIRALLNQPDLLFLDEPTSGLDPSTSRKVHRLLARLKDQGTSIFFTTHDMDEAEKLCDNLVLLNKGQIVEEGAPEDIILAHTTDRQVRLTYADKSSQQLAFHDYDPNLTKQDVVAIHSCEPTLEDIFIQVTGESLYD